MHSLRTKILAITLVFLAFLGIAFVLYSMITTVYYKRLRLESINKNVELETEKVNKTIAVIERAAITLSLDGLLFYQSQSGDIGQIMATEYIRSFPTALGGGFWFEPYAFDKDILRAGIYVFFDKTRREVHAEEAYIAEAYDYLHQNWYWEISTAVKRPYQVVWTKPYIDEVGVYSFLTTAGAGIFDEKGKLIGVSSVDWEIDDVVNRLSSIKPTMNSIVLLCAPESDYIISTTYRNKVSPLLSPGAGASMKKIPWNINDDSFFLDGTKYLLFSRELDNGWLLAVQIPENEIISDIEKQNNYFSIFIAISAAAMICLAYILVSKLINAPLRKLTFDVARLAMGNLDTSIEISSKDEIGLLANTFNKMTSDLKQSIEAYTREHTEKQRIDAELSIAAKIQTAMLPCVFPPFPDKTQFEIFASMHPAKEVGGDFYDFFLIDENMLAVLIADVSGKGVPAALFMAIAKALIKNHVCSGHSPSEVFQTVNNTLCDNNDIGMFVTVFMGYYNLENGEFIYVNAGHNPPLIKTPDKNFEFIEAKPGYVLGFMKGSVYKEQRITLEPGSILYLYTDGVTEAMDKDLNLFSEERLLKALINNDNKRPKELLSAVKHEIKKFTGEAEQADDITMLALEVNHYFSPDSSDIEELEAISTEDESVTDGPIMKEISVMANIDNLEKVLGFINGELGHINCPKDLQNQIDLVIEEIFVNIASYAYNPVSGQAIIGVCAGEKVVIKVEDSGKPFNPLEYATPDFTKPIEVRKIGGLGIYLVKQFMDKVDYLRVNDKNILIMTKKI